MKRVSVAIMVLVMLVVGTTGSAESVHIDRELVSPFVTLKIDAYVDITETDGLMTIYETDLPELTFQTWIGMFDDELDGTEYTVDTSDGDIRVMSDSFTAAYINDYARMLVWYSEREVTTWWSYAVEDGQAENVLMTPHQAKELAVEWVSDLNEKLGWNGFSLSSIHAMPAVTVGSMPGQMNEKGDEAKGYYVVEFSRGLDGYPVAYDNSPYMFDDLTAMIFGDVLQIYIGDEGIFFVEGFYRSYTAIGDEKIIISIDDAIEILQENMDYVRCDLNDGVCIIDEIDLCYRLVQTRATSDPEASVCTEARPVWRFAADTSRGDTNVYFVFIDAITGEVIP